MKALYKRSADVSSGLNKSSLQDMKNLKSLQSCRKIVPQIYSYWKSKLLSPVCDCLILAFCELGPFARKHKFRAFLTFEGEAIFNSEEVRFKRQ